MVGTNRQAGIVVTVLRKPDNITSCPGCTGTGHRAKGRYTLVTFRFISRHVLFHSYFYLGKLAVKLYVITKSYHQPSIDSELMHEQVRGLVSTT